MPPGWRWRTTTQLQSGGENGIRKRGKLQEAVVAGGKNKQVLPIYIAGEDRNWSKSLMQILERTDVDMWSECSQIAAVLNRNCYEC